MKKLILTFLAILVATISNAGFYSIPIYYGGGRLSVKDALAMLIASNLIIFFIYLIRSIIYIFKYKHYGDTWFKYVIFDYDYNYMSGNITTMSLLIVNGIALFTSLIFFILNHL